MSSSKQSSREASASMLSTPYSPTSSSIYSCHEDGERTASKSVSSLSLQQHSKAQQKSRQLASEYQRLIAPSTNVVKGPENGNPSISIPRKNKDSSTSKFKSIRSKLHSSGRRISSHSWRLSGVLGSSATKTSERGETAEASPKTSQAWECSSQLRSDSGVYPAKDSTIADEPVKLVAKGVGLRSK